jgi:hypothetical protein
MSARLTSFALALAIYLALGQVLALALAIPTGVYDPIAGLVLAYAIHTARRIIEKINSTA